MAKATYWELLKHPKWQERRLKVLEREGFRCQWCGDNEKTLHVHHTHYEKGAKPWEYHDRDLLCLCERCHNHADYLRQDITRLVGSISGAHGGSELLRVLGYVKAIAAALDAEAVPQGSYFEYEYDMELVGIADCFGLSVVGLNEARIEDGFDVLKLCELDQRGAAALAMDRLPVEF